MPPFQDCHKKKKEKAKHDPLTCVASPQVKTISDPGVVAVVAVFVAVFVEELLQKGGGGSARVTKLIRRRVGSIPHGIVNRDSLC